MRSGLAPTSPLGNTWDLGRHCIRRSAGGAGSRSILDLVRSQGSLPNGPKLVGREESFAGPCLRRYAKIWRINRPGAGKSNLPILKTKQLNA